MWLGYDAYLHSPEWQQLVDQTDQWDDGTCLVCHRSIRQQGGGDSHRANQPTRHASELGNIRLCRQCQARYQIETTGESALFAPVGIPALVDGIDLDATSAPIVPPRLRPRQIGLEQAFLTLLIGLLLAFFSIGATTDPNPFDLPLVPLQAGAVPTPTYTPIAVNINVAIPAVLPMPTAHVTSQPPVIEVAPTISVSEMVASVIAMMSTFTPTVTVSTPDLPLATVTPSVTSTIAPSVTFTITPSVTPSVAPTASAILAQLSPPAIVTTTVDPASIITATLVSPSLPAIATDSPTPTPLSPVIEQQATLIPTNTVPLTDTVVFTETAVSAEVAEENAIDAAATLPATGTFIHVDDFMIAHDVVTLAEYEHCVQVGICTEPSGLRATGRGSAEEAVTYVTWQQAQTYALSIGGRLPRASEWQRACQTGAFALYERSNTIWEWTSEWAGPESVQIFDAADCMSSRARDMEDHARRLGFRVLFPLP